MTLVVLRGNSGSGKTTAAREVRRRFGRGCALIEQDYVRRIILREHNEAPDAVAPTLIATMAGESLRHGYHVVLEGILDAGTYRPALTELIAAHGGRTFYLDVSFEETVRRHAGRAATVGFTERDMRAWYRPLDLLDVPGEQVIPETSALEDTVATILHASGLSGAAPRSPCPTRCPHCAGTLVPPSGEFQPGSAPPAERSVKGER
ncbi:putative kinase [Actinoplanes tereljensis]|uniref:Kinase n=1 Tax=Paractinoplanes tereljensis TaxID=571912 RepID=A0A919NKN1_9ACTN|nr:AAA family ATPase [Actinoplanes tereljensis]GIF19721.1 hypothetical protein Ate02nite_24510 [Actinoplanes tereljensis]